jgi:hypothetical protein
MYCAQVPKTPGVHLVGIADLAPTNAWANLARVGWPAERAMATSLNAVRWTDVDGDQANIDVHLRREMEQTYAAQPDMVLT